MTAKRGPGRPRKTIDKRGADLVRDLAGIGCTLEEISAVAGLSHDTLMRRPEYANAIKIGREEGKEKLRRKQWNLAMEGHPTMLIWLGKQLLGQTDRQDVTSAGESVNELRIKVVGKRKSDGWPNDMPSGPSTPGNGQRGNRLRV